MAEENASPISAAKPPVANPMASATSVHAATLKLKPVIRKPTIGGAAARPGLKLPTSVKPVSTAPAAPAPAPAPAAPAAPAESAVEQLKSVTQKLKGVTQQIPQQAILHKTGIIAEQELTEAQKAASKSRTARISLSDVMGVAPVKNEAAPMKTIRIKRPDLAVAPAAPKPAAPEPEAAPAAEPQAAEKPAAEEATLTQRKTLKIARPTSKLGVKKPGAPAVKKPEAAAAPADGGDVPEVADIPDMPAPTAYAPMAAAGTCPPDRIPDVGPACQWLGLIVQVAACIAIGFLGWKLYEAVQLPAYCGGTLF